MACPTGANYVIDDTLCFLSPGADTFIILIAGAWACVSRDRTADLADASLSFPRAAAAEAILHLNKHTLVLISDRLSSFLSSPLNRATTKWGLVMGFEPRTSRYTITENH